MFYLYMFLFEYPGKYIPGTWYLVPGTRYDPFPYYHSDPGSHSWLFSPLPTAV